jgi:putative colanic acid biosynthesis acetyltransferase WcaF
VGPGVTIEAGAVALGRAVVTRDVAAWTVVAGNPAKKIRMRRRDAQPTNPEE